MTFLFSYQCVVFDRDPAPKAEDDPEQQQYLKSEAILKNMKRSTENGDTSFLAYMVPKKKSQEENQEGQEIDYEWVREYSFEMKKGSSFADAFFFTLESDQATYNPIKTRINLTKLKYKVFRVKISVL